MVDFMTKTKPPLALKMLINSNLINISTMDYVEWANIKQKHMGT